MCVLFAFLLFPVDESICYETRDYNEYSTINGTISETTGQETKCFNTEIQPIGLRAMLISLWGLFILYFVLMLFDTYKLKKQRKYEE